MIVKFTHKGWFGICPAYFADIESEAPVVVERHMVYLPLMILSEWVFDAAFFIMGIFDEEYEPAWPLRISGKLDPEIIMEIGSEKDA